MLAVIESKLTKIMPFSPLTRFLGITIVLSYAIAILWPDDQSYLWGWKMIPALSLIISLLSWSMVRDAAPFDDRSFHRTLPVANGLIFRRLLGMYGWILLGIAVVVLIYCWVFNFGWRAISYGMVYLTVPVWSMMAATGLAFSLCGSRGYRKLLSCLAVFFVPLISVSLLFWCKNKFQYGVYEKNNLVIDGFIFKKMHILDSVEVAILVAAISYPLIWWMVSVRRFYSVGVLLSGFVGAVLPWVWTYLDFGELPERFYTGESAQTQHRLVIEMKSDFSKDQKWIPIEKMVSITGLKPGEFTDIWFMMGRDAAGDHFGVQLFDVPDQPDFGDRSMRTRLVVSRSADGTMHWGRRPAVWSQLERLIPQHETFTFWNKDDQIPTHLSVSRDSLYAKSEDAQPLPVDESTEIYWPDLHLPIRIYGPGVFKLEEVGIFDLSSGGSSRLAGGGKAVIGKLSEHDNHYSITLKRYTEDLSELKGAWLGGEMSDSIPDAYGQPWLIAIDQSGKHAVALSSGERPSMQFDLVMLGRCYKTTFDLGEVKTPEEIARMEWLRKSKLYVFWSRRVESLPKFMSISK
ncbi:hypothetical protein JIN85_01890 [Luteolibacter pohnpeiensis]|uniref:Uncharacterized protein n=1 Tax=Luteolibacter pohnpeiensis TaxID=454153 RepID=A0A934S4T4_9BACT|nr:hypothetical protein [Luteolibacter pohnpeiensis]MBK1881144.1 hypothetical protein [Luteolibacter pohnpeiensis]